MARSTRVRWMLGGAALLALALGIARGILEEPPAQAPVPSGAQAPAATPRTPPAAPPLRRELTPQRAVAPADARREAIRTRLERDLQANFPELKLSSDEIDAAADALWRLRAARLELNELPRTAENAERIAALTREIGEAYEDFEYVVELDPAEFTERVEPGLEADDEDVGE